MTAVHVITPKWLRGFTKRAPTCRALKSRVGLNRGSSRRLRRILCRAVLDGSEALESALVRVPAQLSQ